MSYNCDGADYISGKLYIDRAVGEMLLIKYENRLPESNLLDYMKNTDEEGVAEIICPAWCHTGSGREFPELYTEILSHTKGIADIVLTWEGGDSLSGFRVTNGIVTQHEVVQALGKKL